MPNNKDTITIGIDSSSKHCGYAIFKNGNLIKTDVFNYEGKYTLQKLGEVTKDFDTLFKKEKPHIVILESPAPVRNSRTLTMLNQIAGAIWSVAAVNGAFIDEIHNKKIKKIMEIKTKQDSIDKVQEIFNYQVANDHEADAVLAVKAYEKRITKNI
jgi:Holliday junction resolvasome RuvABC endonuclease subunit